MKSTIFTSIAATLFSIALIVTAIIVSPARQETEAQGMNEPFGGQFTAIEEICCDGTLILTHQAAGNGLPEGSFQTSWSMDAYRELYYYPLPQTCALGFVRQSGSCISLSSECESTTTPDYTITMIGTSNVGCQLK